MKKPEPKTRVGLAPEWREEWALYKEIGVALETGNNTFHCHTPHPTTLLWQPENHTRWAESATRKSPGKSVGKSIFGKQQ